MTRAQIIDSFTGEPLATAPRRRKVTRRWTGTHRVAVQVSVEHPQVGDLFRGTITALRGDDVQGRWSVLTYDHDPVDNGPIVGDYLDAEAALLAATTELD